MDTDKLTKTANILDRIVCICRGVFRAMVIVLLIFSVLVLIFGEQVFVQNSLSLELGFVKMYLAEEYRTVTPAVKIYTTVSLLCATTSCALLSYACGIFRKILAPMKEGRPFEMAVSVNFRKMAWAALIGGFVLQVFTAVEQVFLIKALPLNEILSSPAISKTEFQFVFDYGFILLALVFLFLSYIFSYGQALQRESDETL